MSTDTAFKNWINPTVVGAMAHSIRQVYLRFKISDFVEATGNFENLELKQRVEVIRKALYQTLPQDYEEALQILVKTSKIWKNPGFGLWPFLDFIRSYGLKHFDASMEAMRNLTPLFSAEFSVRPYLATFPKQSYSLLLRWSTHEDPHIRRWCSEGTRPRLPWGERLYDAVINRTLKALF